MLNSGARGMARKKTAERNLRGGGEQRGSRAPANGIEFLNLDWRAEPWVDEECPLGSPLVAAYHIGRLTHRYEWIVVAAELRGEFSVFAPEAYRLLVRAGNFRVAVADQIGEAYVDQRF